LSFASFSLFPPFSFFLLEASSSHDEPILKPRRCTQHRRPFYLEPPFPPLTSPLQNTRTSSLILGDRISLPGFFLPLDPTKEVYPTLFRPDPFCRIVPRVHFLPLSHPKANCLEIGLSPIPSHRKRGVSLISMPPSKDIWPKLTEFAPFCWRPCFVFPTLEFVLTLSLNKVRSSCPDYFTPIPLL